MCRPIAGCSFVCDGHLLAAGLKKITLHSSLQALEMLKLVELRELAELRKLS